MDFQATEIFEYAQKLGGINSLLTNSLEFQKCRFEYANLLSDYGGFNTNISQYCTEISKRILNHPELSKENGFITHLCNFSEQFGISLPSMTTSSKSHLKSVVENFRESEKKEKEFFFVPSKIPTPPIFTQNVTPMQNFTQSFVPIENNLQSQQVRK